MKSIAVIILFFASPLFVSSQLPKDIVWQAIYGTDEEEVVEDIVETQDAYYILSRTTIVTGPEYNEHHNDLLVTKTNSDGQFIWQINYGGSGFDGPASIVADSLGEIYLGGGSNSNDGDVQSGNMGGLDFWIVKIDTSGHIIWEQTYGGSRDDYGAYLIYLENGNILAYGATFSSDHDVNINYGFLDIWMWEITPHGEIVNSRVFGSSINDNIFSLIQTRDGGFFTAARAGTNDGVVNGNPHGWYDVWLLKLDAELNIEWQKLLGGSKSDSGGKGILELDNGYIINGKTESSNGDVHGNDFPDVPNQDDIWVVRIDSIGNILWDIALGGDESEYDSKIFQNQDGSFTVFGTTGSPNNGDVEGKHHTFQYPNSINKDIWMVHLSENGEFLDQRCFGNSYDTELRRGVIKKSDSHYLIAGKAVSREANPENPHLPTDGEVWGGYESDSFDIWFFEIKDCAQDTLAPFKPIGADSICMPSEEIYSYYSQINTEEYTTEWQLTPETAGNLSFLQDTATIIWNLNFKGMANLYLNTTTNCGTSPYSDTLEIQVFQPILNQAPAGPDTICSVNNQESYFTINNDIEPSLVLWQIEPKTAGIITTQQDTAIITWSISYEGEVSLNTTIINNCGTIEHSPNKQVQLRTCLGVGEQTYSSLKVYPNPAQDYIIFELPKNTKESSLIISDIYGKTIAELNTKDQTQIKWDCTKLASGVYFYHIVIGGKNNNGKILLLE